MLRLPGLSADTVLNAVQENAFDHVSAIYHLLADRLETTMPTLPSIQNISGDYMPDGAQQLEKVKLLFYLRPRRGSFEFLNMFWWKNSVRFLITRRILVRRSWGRVGRAKWLAFATGNALPRDETTHRGSRRFRASAALAISIRLQLPARLSTLARHTDNAVQRRSSDVTGHESPSQSSSGAASTASKFPDKGSALA